VVDESLKNYQITGGFRHSSIVVQMEKVGAKSYPATSRFAPSLTPSSAISRNSSSAVRFAGMGVGQRHRHVQVVGARLERGTE